MADEIIDIYDCNMNHLGTAPRSQAHKEGLWHKAFHCWIVKRASDGNHRVLLQLRSKNKDSHPSLLDISAAGHLQAGETPKDGIREIEEELGLKVDFDKLTKLFTINHVGEHRNYINREFNPTYLLESEKNLSELNMNPEEVDGILEATVEDLKKIPAPITAPITINIDEKKVIFFFNGALAKLFSCCILSLVNTF